MFQKFVPVVNCIFRKAFDAQFEENIYFFIFAPNVHLREFFSRHIFPAHFVGFLFSYFCRFLLFSPLFRENECVHC